MNDISAIASSAVAVKQSKLQGDVTVSLLRMNAQSEQAVANMVAQNTRLVEVLYGNSLGGNINLFA